MDLSDNKNTTNSSNTSENKESHVVNPYASRKWKIPKPKDCIIIAVSSRVLFDMREERKIWDEQGTNAYIKHMVANENKPLKPGAAFSFIHALESINLKLLEMNPNEKRLFDVVLMSNNSAQVGISLINSVNHHRIAAATLYPNCDRDTVESSSQLRIAFDGDAVLFSDESEIIPKSSGLENFFKNEEKKADMILEHGPLKKFAMQLGEIRAKFKENCPIRTYLVTARSAASSGLRALRTLRKWGLDIDEALFLAGAPKGPILEKIRPHLFFDDQQRNIDSGLQHGVNAAYVPYGVARKYDRKQAS